MTPSLRLLLIDDNPDDRALAIRVLERHFRSPEIVQINDAQSLAPAMASLDFDAVITDYSLGWTNGIAILEEVKARRPNLPVIMFTLTGSEEICAEGMKKGLHDYVLKHQKQYTRLPFVVQSAIEFAHTKELLKERELELQRRAEELAEENRRKDEFLAMLAHELRNPLAAISSAAEILHRPDVEEDWAWSKDVISRQSRHLARLLEDLLDVARITQGIIQIRKQRIDALRVLHDSVAAVKHLMDERNHALQVSLPAAPLEIDADPARLQQIVVNLLSNAATYTPEYGKISLMAQTTENELIITVQDTGLGIAATALPHVFDPFVQGQRTMARSEGGLGVGLTIVKRLVELHGGSVAATSEGPGQGSQFVVRIPVAPQQPVVETPATSKPAWRKDGPIKVLAVDDNVDLVRTLAMMLKLDGYEVRTAYDGTEALNIAADYYPEFVLLDIGLPGADGYQVAQRLRSQECCRDSVLIAITGYGRDEDRARSREAGFNHHLVKPVDYRSLKSLMAAAIARSNANLPACSHR